MLLATTHHLESTAVQPALTAGKTQTKWKAVMTKEQFEKKASPGQKPGDFCEREHELVSKLSFSFKSPITILVSKVNTPTRAIPLHVQRHVTNVVHVIATRCTSNGSNSRYSYVSL